MAEKARQILVVEDDPDIRNLVSTVLKRAGYEVKTAEDGRRAVALIDGEPPVDVVLLDCMMPHVGGIEVLGHLRAKPEWTRTHVFMLTSEADDVTVQAALAGGADDYFLKPFRPPVLLARLQRLFES
jgi:two-component system alkaline phosphatase synthesis response regulator PhoP